MNIKIAKCEGTEDLLIPSYQSEGSAGMDLYANIKENVIITAGERMAIPTGICIELPIGYEAQVRPRSGLALKYGISIVNSPGTIDSDFRGEIKAILINLGKEDFIINRGERIAQLVISKYEKINFELSDNLSETERSTGGFGSTGIN